MKTVRNLTRNPLRVPLPGGKILHLGPGKTGTISDAAIEAPGVQRLLQSKSLELTGSGEGAVGEGSGGSAQSPHESTHGHPPTTVVSPRGNR